MKNREKNIALYHLYFYIKILCLLKHCTNGNASLVVNVHFSLIGVMQV